MKRFIFLLTTIFMCIGAYAKTETINWYMDGNTYATTQCETGSDIILPQTPYKYGYTFNGWIGYTPIEYLESTGTQWIDTGVVANETTEAEIEFSDLKNGNLFLASTGSWSSENFGIIFGGSSNKISFYMNCDGVINYSFIPGVTYSGNLKLLLNGFFFNGQKMNITSGKIPSTNSFSTKYPITLFAANMSGIARWPSVFKVYFFKLWQDSILVRDFIPVLDADGTPCMYDRVEGKFYYNQGTGQFVAGPVIGG